jgi:hypothetical protein
VNHRPRRSGAHQAPGHRTRHSEPPAAPTGRPGHHPAKRDHPGVPGSWRSGHDQAARGHPWPPPDRRPARRPRPRPKTTRCATPPRPEHPGHHRVERPHLLVPHGMRRAKRHPLETPAPSGTRPGERGQPPAPRRRPAAGYPAQQDEPRTDRRRGRAPAGRPGTPASGCRLGIPPRDTAARDTPMRGGAGRSTRTPRGIVCPGRGGTGCACRGLWSGRGTRQGGACGVSGGARGAAELAAAPTSANQERRPSMEDAELRSREGNRTQHGLPENTPNRASQGRSPAAQPRKRSTEVAGKQSRAARPLRGGTPHPTPPPHPREARDARREARGARREARGARREARGARREARGARREARRSLRPQRRPTREHPEPRRPRAKPRGPTTRTQN